MTHNRTWLAFANESICNHRKALKVGRTEKKMSGNFIYQWK